jgi:hypothetical protein
MVKESLSVIVTFTEPTLGTANANPKLHEEFVASKSADAEKMKEELEGLPAEELIDKATTVFMQEDNNPFIFDYQVRGFFKGQIGTLVELDEPCAKSLSKWTFKRAVDTMLFAAPRKVFFHDPKGNRLDGTKLETHTRPMRVSTMRGDRVCLATSQMIPAGTEIAFRVEWFVNAAPAQAKGRLRINEELIRAALDLGVYYGFSQWRGGGFGRFIWKEAKA